jgi:hypothetical protein
MIRQTDSKRSFAKMKGITYITDAKGKRKAVILDLQMHKEAIGEFLEDLYGHRKISERVGEKTVSKEQFIKGLKRDGLL